MGQIYSIQEYKVDKLFTSHFSIIMFFCHDHQIMLNFNSNDFHRLYHHLYCLYEAKNHVYQFDEDMRLYLYSTLEGLLQKHQKRFKIEDFLDGIYFVEIERKQAIEIEKNKALCKLQNIGESYYV